MVFAETYYVAVNEGDQIPSQDEWLENREDAEDSARSNMEYNGSFEEMLGYEITIRPVFRAVPSVAFENV